MSKRRPPPATRIPRNFHGEPIIGIEELTVGSWCPALNGKGPATQVHVYLKLVNIQEPLVLRFKSARGLDNFIDVLKRHRFDVWPHEPVEE